MVLPVATLSASLHRAVNSSAQPEPPDLLPWPGSVRRHVPLSGFFTDARTSAADDLPRTCVHPSGPARARVVSTTTCLPARSGDPTPGSRRRRRGVDATAHCGSRPLANHQAPCGAAGAGSDGGSLSPWENPWLSAEDRRPGSFGRPNSAGDLRAWSRPYTRRWPDRSGSRPPCPIFEGDAGSAEELHAGVESAITAGFDGIVHVAGAMAPFCCSGWPTRGVSSPVTYRCGRARLRGDPMPGDQGGRRRRPRAKNLPMTFWMRAAVAMTWAMTVVMT